MIRKAFRVGDIITIKCTSHVGTGYRYTLVRLTGGVVLVEELSEDADTLGGMSVQSFTLQSLQPGQVEIQFAYYRDTTGVPYEDVFPYTVVISKKTDIIIGGWGESESLTDQDRELFQTCMTLKEVDYTPLLIVKQLVSGYNYRFICMTRTTTCEPKYGFAKVTIYVLLGGEPLLESIVEY